MSTTAPMTATESDDFACTQLVPAKHIPTLLDDARDGLLAEPRSLPPKYFYDALGSELFDQICDTEEYYPTRVESTLLERSANKIIEIARPEYVIELGSGTSRKTRFLFDACAQAQLTPKYWPMDVCGPMLEEAAESLQQEYDWLNINAFVGDYHGGFKHFPRADGRALYVFLGGTVGNFEHAEAVELLADVRALMKPNDHILLGFDRVKDVEVLEAAYNDAEGATAEFNLNLLRVLNKELDADFKLDGFQHKAVYNEVDNQIEMYLVSDSDQVVTLDALQKSLKIQSDERIRTEISRKFTTQSIVQLLEESGLTMVNHQQADQGYYSLVLAKA